MLTLKVHLFICLLNFLPLPLIAQQPLSYQDRLR